MFTSTEYSVFLLYRHGATRKEVEHALLLSRHTVDQHRKAVCRKLGALNITHAVEKFHTEVLDAR